jgi:ABC-type nitrate/sulfonate/bicarbonate transport system ATPase subunit
LNLWGNAREGSDLQTRLEAPAEEPLSFQTTDVAVTGVTRRYVPTRRRREPVVALDGMSLEVRAGEVVAVVGPSGCGKSTLLELIAGLQEADAGAIGVGDLKDARDRLRACAYMPQRDGLLPWRDALGNAALALECQGFGRARARNAAAELFERFGLDGFERAMPPELSGGMRQRVAFVRTLLAGRPVLLLDEPFGALDSLTRGQMQEWLASALATEPRTVVLVTHDVDEALLLADRVAIMSPRPGRIVATLDVDLARPRARRQTVVLPEFAALKEQALEALGQ